MIGLVIVLGLIVTYFTTTLESTNAFEQSETIRLHSIPAPEEKATGGEVKEQWLVAFSMLLNESIAILTIDLAIK